MDGPPPSKRRYTPEELLDISKRDASKVQPPNLPSDIATTEKRPLALTWSKSYTNCAHQLAMRRDLGRPTPAKTSQRPNAGGKTRGRTWKQVFPIAQYQLSDQRNQGYPRRPASDAEPNTESLFTRLRQNATGVPPSDSEGAESVAVSSLQSSHEGRTSPANNSRAAEAAASSTAPLATKELESCAPDQSLQRPAIPALLTAPVTADGEEEEGVISSATAAHSPAGTLAVSVLHTTEPVTFTELQPLTNLNKPPPNWLKDDKRVLHTYNPGAPRVEGGEFLSSTLASTLMLKDAWDHSDSDSAESQDSDRYLKPPLPRNIDIIAPAENLKKLFMATHNDSPLALTIHRIGSSLVLEGEVATSCRKSTKKVQARSMLSKFLYYSILAEQVDESIANMKKKSHAIPLPAKGQEAAFKQANPWMGPGSSSPYLENCGRAFSRTLHWKFQDLNLLLGSNTLIMQMRDKSEVSVKMRDEPLSQAEALDYWLDNVMTNVPNVAICFHKEGIIQGYQLVSTSDLPSVSESTHFDPKVVEEYCGSVLHWLKDNCTSDTGSYLLVREKKSNLLQLYDLGELHRQAEVDDPTERPFAYSVGMMCFRMGDRLLNSHDDQDRAEARDLLMKSVQMVSEEQDPGLIALAHAKIAQTYLPVEEVEVSDGDDHAEVEGVPKASGNSSVKRRRKKKGKAKAKKAEEMKNADTEKAKPPSGTLITVDSRREHSKRALDHLEKGLQILQNHAEGGVPDPIALRRITESQVQCYLELARVDAVSLNISDAFRWIDLTIEKLPLCAPNSTEGSSQAADAGTDSEVPGVLPMTHQPYSQEASSAPAKRNVSPRPDSDTVSNAPNSQDEEHAWQHFRALVRRTKVSIYHTLGDMHYAIASQLEVDGGERSMMWVQEHEKVIRELLAKRKVAQAASNGTGVQYLQAEAIFSEFIPLSMDIKNCFSCGIKMYEKAAALSENSKEKLDLRRKKAAAHTEIAKAVMVAGDLHGAQELFATCLETWKELSDVANQVLTLNNMGRVDHALAAEEQKANSKIEVQTPAIEKADKEDHTNNGINQTERHDEDLSHPSPRPASPDDANHEAAEVEDPMLDPALNHVSQGPVLCSLGSCAIAGNMSVHEENLRYSAIKRFSDAAGLLSMTETHRTVANWGSLKKVTDGNLAFAYFELAARLKQNFTALFSSKKDVEKAIAELFLRSITLYELAGQHEKMAFAQCYVASLYFSAWQHRYVPVGSTTALTQLNDKRFKFSEIYYRKALQYYMGALQEVQHPHQLNNMMPRVLCALAELYRFAYITGGSRINLENALTMLQHCKPWFVVAYKLIDDPSVRSSPWSTALFPIPRPAASPTESRPQNAEAQHLRSMISEQSAQVSKHVKEELMLFLKANRPTANEYQQAKVAYSLALKSSDILQILDSVQRIKVKAMLSGIKNKPITPIL